MKPDAANHNPSPEYLRSLLARAGLTQRGAARLLDIRERQMRRYLAGDAEAPYCVQYALEGLADE